MTADTNGITTDMTLPKLIGIGYRARSGKDTVAEYIKRYGYHRVACADGIREVARIITDEDPFDPEFKTSITRLGVTGGQLLQECGTLLKQIDPEIWTKMIERQCRVLLGSRSPLVVIPDIRFKSEEAMVRRLGGTLWRIDRPGLANDPHISEQEGATIQWDAVIKNNGSLADLYRAVDGLLGL
jgi:hypothetical protein